MEEVKKTPEDDARPIRSVEFLKSPEFIKVWVSLAIIEKDGKFLIGKRPSHKPYGGKWEFPGGKIKIEEKETPEQCLVREVREELDVAIEEMHPYLEFDFQFPDGNFFHLVAFRCKISGDPQPGAQDEIRWVSVEELGDYDFMDSDKVLVGSLNRSK